MLACSVHSSQLGSGGLKAQDPPERYVDATENPGTSLWAAEGTWRGSLSPGLCFGFLFLCSWMCVMKTQQRQQGWGVLEVRLQLILGKDQVSSVTR